MIRIAAPWTVCLLAMNATLVSATWFAGDFEELGTSARAIGMGGAVVASATGPTAIYYNPALAGRVDRIRTFFLHSEDFAGLVHHNFLGVTFPSGPQAFGIAVLHNGIPGIKLTRLADSTKPGPNEGNPPIIDRVVSANQFVGYVNYSRAITPHLALGVNAKIIYHDLTVGSCFGMGLDLGAAVTPGAGFDIGLRARNTSTSPLFWTTGTRESVHPVFALGVGRGFQLGRDALNLAIETEFGSEDQRLSPSFGAEYSFRNSLFARLGSHDGNFTFGLGARYRRVFLDYGYTTGYSAGSQELGSSQQLSGGVEF